MDKLNTAIIKRNIKMVAEALKEVAPNEDHLVTACVLHKPEAGDILRLLLKDGRVDPREVRADLFTAALQCPEAITALLEDGRVDPSKEENRAIKAAFRMVEVMPKDYSAREVEIWKKIIKKPGIETIKLLLSDPRVSDSLGDEQKFRYMQLVEELAKSGKKKKSTRRKKHKKRARRTRC
jgi:hypothetical protein